jgi:phosphatidyl-myo-inositol dimannoside synthase
MDITEAALPRTLLVTNDYPPRVGGIQRTLEALWRELPPDRVSVLAPTWDGADAFDAAAPYTIVREPSEFIWPTRAFAARLDDVIASLGVEVVLFGDAFPLAALGPRLAKRGTPYLVAAHGFDYWLSVMPGAHTMMKYMTSAASRVPVMCSEFIARTVRTAVPPAVPVSILYPGADLQAFHPDLPTAALRERLGVEERPLVVCVSRLVARKGQDVLIEGIPRIRRRVPNATLVIVGGGPYEEELRTMAEGAPDGSVVFAGQVPEEDLPRYYAMGDVFAMPCRTRLAGMEVEGWGNVFIEASACGRPIVVGDSGGARETVIDGETGLLVDGSDVEQVADAVADLLSDPERARRMGAAGRERVERAHAWPAIAGRLAGWLREAVT